MEFFAYFKRVKLTLVFKESMPGTFDQGPPFPKTGDCPEGN
jgi:hypothetical protein